MLRKTLLSIVRKRDPDFKFPDDLTISEMIIMVFGYAIALVRGIVVSAGTAGHKAVLAGHHIQFEGRKETYFGKLVRIGNYVQIKGYGQKGLSFGDYASIGSFSVIKVSYSRLHKGKAIKIGNRTGIGEYAHIGGAGGLYIGDDCIIGPYFSCHPENHNYGNPLTLVRMQGVTAKGITIGNNCWIGAKVTVLDGVSIGNNCVVAAGAVVTRDIPDNAVAAGVPANIVKQRSYNDEMLTIKNAS